LRRSRAARAAPSDRQLRELGGSGSGPTLRPARGTVGPRRGRSDAATTPFDPPSRPASARPAAPPTTAALPTPPLQPPPLSPPFPIPPLQPALPPPPNPLP